MALFLCGALAAMYVGVLYAPPILLKIRAKTQRQLLLQRFVCATLASVLSPLVCFIILPVGSSSKLNLMGIRSDYLMQATLYPLLLTALLYLGPLFVELLELIDGEQAVATDHGFMASLIFLGQDVVAWRNYVVAPLSEEIVFRACMIPLLLCGGYSPTAAILISPTFFSLAHVHRFWELVHHERFTPKRAAFVVVAQLGYTIVFGCYAAFLYVRTGHLIAAVVPHIFCNIMGFPDLVRACQNRVLAVVHIVGLVAFMALAAPLSSPALYNNDVLDCKCWQGFCGASSSSKP
ncbi:CAAX prenyl protease 2 [Selaginella moellendorffii]|uniref:CAAX prenyl protease 2 n=1 Tax=Selaginella moellendorffii TaxID=88036 RepID=UPI000D1C5D4B|nr:CAAX prenyl protease 2 [Selaginella moellendorffii]|eukprot:XP_024540057.1 CAAX prenyl protease 2 [Selaginella moellendorffii]